MSATFEKTVADYNKTIADGAGVVAAIETLLRSHGDELLQAREEQSKVDAANATLSGADVLTLSPAEQFALSKVATVLPTVIASRLERAAALEKDIKALSKAGNVCVVYLIRKLVKNSRDERRRVQDEQIAALSAGGFLALQEWLPRSNKRAREKSRTCCAARQR